MKQSFFSEQLLNIYELVKAEELPDINSMGYLLKHKKSGAKISVIYNDDENKVFSIGFRTPPQDSTGVAHIVEHSVLCGSEKYPVKDPFVELAKGSLNTFLNAMTYPDKTVYPVASCNMKDFKNLMSVYMDAVLLPNMLKNSRIFEQEGWHYEMEDVSKPITVNGVVYNEMRGVFSSPDQQLARLVQKVLFPDTPYGNESGGDPDDIPNLTYKDFVAFHKKYYHPSNSYIYLYGDMDIQERLTWLDESYLSKYDRIDAESVIPMQTAFDKMKEVDEMYSAQKEDDKAYFSYNCVVENALDSNIQLAFQILTYALVIIPGAPLKQALTDAGIGEEITGSFDSEVLQPSFSIVAREAGINKKDEFVSIIRDTLKKLIKEGIDKKSLQAAISYYEFKYREADYGRYPKGLMYGLQSMQTWLYDDNDPFSVLLPNNTFEFLKSMIGTDYYEKLIDKYLLNNPHSAIVSIFPEVGLNRKKDSELAKKLAKYKESLSAEEIRAIADNTRMLREYQENPDSHEDILKIPLIEREDIEKKAPEVYLDKKRIGNTDVLHHNIFTNEIAYIICSFDITDLKKYTPYFTLLTYILGNVDTKNYSYLDLGNEINLNSGGIDFGVNVMPYKNNTDKYSITMEISIRVLFSSIEKAFELTGEMIRETVFSDKKRIKDVLSEIRSDAKSVLESSGNATAVDRSLSYQSESAFYQNQMSGISAYRFIDEICRNFDKHADKLIDTLMILINKIFDRDRLTISFTADDKGYGCFEKNIESFLKCLYDNDKQSEILSTVLPDIPMPEMGVWNEGFTTPGKVQYVARTGNFIKKGYEYTGALKVVRTILNYDYLWQNVRVKGGAYGASCGFLRSGNGYFSSYRDPKLSQTDEIYKGAADYLRSFEADEREMTKYIIGTMSEVDTPLTPRAKGRKAFSMYQSGVTKEDIQKERDEILGIDVKKIRECGNIVDAVAKCDNICVVGSEAAIEAQKDMFGNVCELCN